MKKKSIDEMDFEELKEYLSKNFDQVECDCCKQVLHCMGVYPKKK